MKNTAAATKRLSDTEQFVSVTEEQFFAVIGPMNVHPKPEGKYDPTYGYLSLWENLNNRAVVGKSTGGTTFSASEYQLRRDLAVAR